MDLVRAATDHPGSNYVGHQPAWDLQDAGSGDYMPPLWREECPFHGHLRFGHRSDSRSIHPLRIAFSISAALLRLDRKDLPFRPPTSPVLR